LNGDVPHGRNGHLALVATAKIDGRSCLMQIDTGVNEAVRWQQVDSERVASVTIALAAMERRAA